MSVKELDTVVLETDLSRYGLKRGDIGAVVHVYSPHAIEVEFVTASGHTQALVTLAHEQFRPVGPSDIPAVRKLDAA
ncbi:MAG TPA: DUF4926 domain-containing protein [Gammaproteobacteria bacterium]|nr:DUF4926 domain-containing protein [Gammaproteobacteria bacterium]